MEALLTEEGEIAAEFREAAEWLKTTLDNPAPPRRRVSRRSERAAWIATGAAALFSAYAFPVWLALALARHRPDLVGLGKSGVELVRIRHYSFWEREKDVSCVPASGALKIELRTSAGLSEAVAKKVGLNAGFEWESGGSIGADWSRTKTTTETRQAERIVSVAVRNNSEHEEQLLVVYRPKRVLVIEKLAMSETGEMQWVKSSEDEYYASGQPFIVKRDRRRPPS